MKNIGVFVSENFQFSEVKFCIYLNRSVFVMVSCVLEDAFSLDKAWIIDGSRHLAKTDIIIFREMQTIVLNN